MVRIDRVVTRGGDGGETSLGDGKRVPKSAPRVDAFGTIDEANAAIGVLRVLARGDAEADAMLARVQNELFDLGADLATPPAGAERPALRIVEGQVERLEREIDRLNEPMPPLTSFILPGGSAGATALHFARTVCRRAERASVALGEHEAVGPQSLKYLNRLSDLLFVAARHANDQGRGDVLWAPGATR